MAARMKSGAAVAALRGRSLWSTAAHNNLRRIQLLKRRGLTVISMEDRKEKNAPWLSVPQFGDWDMKGEVPDYSLDFSKIRENRKLNKRDTSRASIGNEEELIANSNNRNSKTVVAHSDHHYHENHQHIPTARRSIFSYFNCCVKA